MDPEGLRMGVQLFRRKGRFSSERVRQGRSNARGEKGQLYVDWSRDNAKERSRDSKARRAHYDNLV